MDARLFLLNDEYCLIDLLENAATASGAVVIQTISKKFDPQGVTVCLSISREVEQHVYKHVIIITLGQKIGRAALVSWRIVCSIFACHGDCKSLEIVKIDLVTFYYSSTKLYD
jgi:S-adenosylmethionine/arginine decarboxylase-like enzyme